MKIKLNILFISILLQFGINCSSQNLVSNGDLEYYTFCDRAISNAPNWYNPTNASPDYLNECNSDIYYSVPFNHYGFQNAHSGISYALIGITLNWL